MATPEKDPVTGRNTTGHEWDGIKELNTPLPKWWVYVFYASIVWAVGYWIVYPAWPTLTTYTKGIIGYSSRGELASDMQAAKDARGVWLAKFENASVEDIKKDPTLLNYALAGGKSAFAENCAPCHGSGGAGAYGYPTLADDEWIWGGTLDDIKQTITYGVRNPNENARAGEMPKFADGMLTAEQIATVSDYVLNLSKGPQAAAGSPDGAALFAENCAACHAEDGSGQAAMGAPALNNGLWLYKGNKESIVAQVSNPKHGSMPAWGGRLDETTIKQLTVYVHSRGGGK
jgi:cytochrome c oxidase cbb3-type subunit 3